MRKIARDVSYFPGCSLASTAKENNEALKRVFQHLDYNLVELEDWNCCGSSSAHSIDPELGTELAARNLSLAPEGRPLLVACPSCLIRLRQAHLQIRENASLQEDFEIAWGRPFDPDLRIIHFFELLEEPGIKQEFPPRLQGLKFVPYYGCMLARPPCMRLDKNYHGLIESVLARFGAKALTWPHASVCCGTFLSVARPDVVTPMVNNIVRGAIDAGANCIVTACAMCQMNIEVRCNLKEQLPIIPLSQMLTLAMHLEPLKHKKMLAQHLVDPRPLLRSIGLI
jgi:heterodisulfide reductase subunit B